jgi:hypothetical protein
MCQKPGYSEGLAASAANLVPGSIQSCTFETNLLIKYTVIPQLRCDDA